MSIGREFDRWANNVREMEEHHWHTARYALGRIPVEPGNVVLDLGCGSGYAARALRDIAEADLALGLDASHDMVQKARTLTTDAGVNFVQGRFELLPVQDGTIDHVFSMEAFYYSPNPERALREIRRVLRPGGMFTCCVNYHTENRQNLDLSERLDVDVFCWSSKEYRAAFREAGLTVAAQDNIPD